MTAGDPDGDGGGAEEHPHGRRKRSLWSPRRERALFILAMVVAAASLWWAGFRVMGDGPAAAPFEPGLDHVHALAQNPADGSLLVATHHGTFRIKDDQPARRVGANYQDVMGLAVAGPDDLLGSGHPDLAAARDGAPALLGLIESDNAGVTWKTVSLEGAADFHALVHAHGQVWGWESSKKRFMVSADRHQWDVRSTRDMVAFAVDPADENHVVSAAADGLARSTDGGRTWQRQPGPLLTVLSWDREAGLVGADGDGTVHRSGDAGASWQAVGVLPGPPQAILVTDGLWWAAAAPDGGPAAVYLSRDLGRRWKLRYQDEVEQP